MLAEIDYIQEDTSRYLADGSALNRLLQEASYLPRCSIGKEALQRGEMLTRPREYAIKYPYMQVNRPDMVSWLIFDLDHDNPLIWEDENLPAPNIIVQNRNNGKAHLYYAIPPVCTSERARSKPIQYMKAVYEAMAARLAADPSYRGPVAKTPGHKWWVTREIHSKEYSLGELEDYLELSIKPMWSKGPDLEAVADSRHCLLFEETRFYAYSIVNREKNTGSYEGFYRLVEAFARNKNNYRRRGFSMDLTYSQVKATVKSICRWTWDKYTGNKNCHQGVMKLDRNIPLVARQRIAAKRTHTERQKGSEYKIRAACRILLKKGEKATLVAISKISGLTRQTVAKYKHVIDSTKPVEIVPLKGLMQKHKNVNFAIHQITAPQGGSNKKNISPEIKEPTKVKSEKGMVSKSKYRSPPDYEVP